MALTILIKSNTKMKELIKATMPVKSDFVSNTSLAPFSTKNPILAPYTLEKPHQSILIGTAVDYLFRFMVARVISNNKRAALENTVASHSVEILGGKAYKDFAEQYKIIYERYNKHLVNVEGYIYGVDCFDLAVDAAIYFAKLDVLYRVGVVKKYVDDILEEAAACIYKDVVNVANVFKMAFIDSGVVTPNSDVVFNPAFGSWSDKCGGADADIFIDGILYDFKCTKEVGWRWDEVGQVYAYYLLNLLCKRDHETNRADLVDKEIRGIAIYHSRYGLINKCIFSDEKKLESERVIADLAEIINEPVGGFVGTTQDFSAFWREFDEYKKLEKDPKLAKLTPSEFPFKRGDRIDSGAFAGVGVIRYFYFEKGRWLVVVDFENGEKYRFPLAVGTRWRRAEQ